MTTRYYIVLVKALVCWFFHFHILVFSVLVHYIARYTDLQYYTCCKVQFLMFDLLLNYLQSQIRLLAYTTLVAKWVHHCTDKKMMFPMYLNGPCIPFLGKILGTRLIILLVMHCVLFWYAWSLEIPSISAGLSFLVDRACYIHRSIISAAADSIIPEYKSLYKNKLLPCFMLLQTFVDDTKMMWMIYFLWLPFCLASGKQNNGSSKWLECDQLHFT